VLLDPGVQARVDNPPAEVIELCRALITAFAKAGYSRPGSRRRGAERGQQASGADSSIRIQVAVGPRRNAPCREVNRTPIRRV
jgi:hypothetical protein